MKKFIAWNLLGLAGAAMAVTIFSKRSKSNNPRSPQHEFTEKGPSQCASEESGVTNFVDTTVNVEVHDDVEAVASRVADLVAETVKANPYAVLALPTGSTPLPVYQELARRVSTEGLDFSRTTVFILDEYVGISSGDPSSYRATIRSEATRPLGIPDNQVHGPDATADDLHGAAVGYEFAIREAGGVDLLLAGLGRNGHVAFNEPGTPLDWTTHVAYLTETTRSDNARFFEDGLVPTQAITQGPATLAAARQIILIATGDTKAEAVAAAVTDPVSSVCPASIVQVHSDAVVVVDRHAARFLK